jgi:hypothetical protein
MSHIQEENCGLEDQMLLSFKWISQLRTHSVLPMLLTLRVLLKPNRSSLLKLLRRLKTLVNKKPVRINTTHKLVLRERPETLSSTTKPLVVTFMNLSQELHTPLLICKRSPLLLSQQRRLLLPQLRKVRKSQKVKNLRLNPQHQLINSDGPTKLRKKVSPFLPRSSLSNKLPKVLSRKKTKRMMMSTMVKLMLRKLQSLKNMTDKLKVVLDMTFIQRADGIMIVTIKSHLN